MPGGTYTDISCSAAISSIRQFATLQSWLHAAFQLLRKANLQILRSSLCRLSSMNSLKLYHQDTDVYIAWQPASTKADTPSSRPGCCCAGEHLQALHLILRNNPDSVSTVQDLPAGSALSPTQAKWAHLHVGMQTNISYQVAGNRASSGGIITRKRLYV